MSKLNPPFRADHVGSLLRPKALLDARERHQQSRISKEQLREVEDRHIRDVIKKQEAIGLKSILELVGTVASEVWGTAGSGVAVH